MKATKTANSMQTFRDLLDESIKKWEENKHNITNPHHFTKWSDIGVDRSESYGYTTLIEKFLEEKSDLNSSDKAEILVINDFIKNLKAIKAKLVKVTSTALQINSIDLWISRLKTVDKYYSIRDNIISSFSLENWFLSNFYEQEVTINGVIYKTAEHAFNSLKCPDTKECLENKQAIENAKTAKESRIIGLQSPTRPDWETSKTSIMKTILSAKFKIEEMKDFLNNTKNAYIVNGNLYHDNFWGICIVKDCKMCKDVVGENNSGNLMMEVREENRNH